MGKIYRISISGESEGYCYRELSDAEYELVKGILYDCDSEYIGCNIEEAEILYIVKVIYDVNIPKLGIKQQNQVIIYHDYVSDYSKRYIYYDVPGNNKFPERQKCYFFKESNEAELFANKIADELKCNIFKMYSSI